VNGAGGLQTIWCARVRAPLAGKVGEATSAQRRCRVKRHATAHPQTRPRLNSTANGALKHVGRVCIFGRSHDESIEAGLDAFAVGSTTSIRIIFLLPQCGHTIWGSSFVSPGLANGGCGAAACSSARA
jgi:hypothetical protein